MFVSFKILHCNLLIIIIIIITVYLSLCIFILSFKMFYRPPRLTAPGLEYLSISALSQGLYRCITPTVIIMQSFSNMHLTLLISPLQKNGCDTQCYSCSEMFSTNSSVLTVMPSFACFYFATHFQRDACRLITSPL